jgi:hypothetical protein
MSDAFGKKINDKHTIKYEIVSVNSPIHVVGFLSDARRIDWGQSVTEKSASTKTLTDEEEAVVRPVTP